MSECPDCQDMTAKYGCPDRRCEAHWNEDHPNGFSTKLTDIDPDVLALLLGGKL